MFTIYLDDEDRLREELKDLIDDAPIEESGSDGEDSDASNAGPKKRKKSDDELDDRLEDEDYDLIEENLGVKVARVSFVKNEYSCCISHRQVGLNCVRSTRYSLSHSHSHKSACLYTLQLQHAPKNACQYTSQLLVLLTRFCEIQQPCFYLLLLHGLN